MSGTPSFVRRAIYETRSRLERTGVVDTNGRLTSRELLQRVYNTLGILDQGDVNALTNISERLGVFAAPWVIDGLASANNAREGQTVVAQPVAGAHVSGIVLGMELERARGRAEGPPPPSPTGGFIGRAELEEAADRGERRKEVAGIRQADAAPGERTFVDRDDVADVLGRLCSGLDVDPPALEALIDERAITLAQAIVSVLLEHVEQAGPDGIDLSAYGSTVAETLGGALCDHVLLGIDAGRAASAEEPA